MTRAARRLAVRGRPEAISVVNIVSGRGTEAHRPAGGCPISWRSRGDLVAISCDLVSARHAHTAVACAADTESPLTQVEVE